jgi:hypothetical protein
MAALSISRGIDVMGQQLPQASAAKFEKLAYSITSSARAITEAGTVYQAPYLSR